MQQNRVDPLEDPNILPSQAFTTAAALLESVDKKVIVSLRDGRKLFGVLRSFDQFANLVLQDTIERIYTKDGYGEVKRGVYIVRGENVALLGEIDMEKEEIMEESKVPGSTSALTKFDFQEIERLYKDEVESKRKLDRDQEKKLNQFGLNAEPFSDNLY